MANAVVSRTFLYDAIASQWYEGVNFQAHLYTNNYTPTVDSVISDFTEADYDTYPAGGIAGVPTPFTDSGNEVAATPVAAVFPAPTADGPVTIYGFFVTYHRDAGQGYEDAVLYSAKFGTSVELTNGGSTLPLILSSVALDLNNP